MKQLGLIVIGLILAAAAATGCNVSSQGEEGNVLFTPNQCGRLTCDFDLSVGVGGSVLIHIAAANGGISTSGVDLQSSDEDVFVVDVVPDVGGEPTWELLGAGDGVADLIAITRTGGELDHITVPVQELTGLGSANVVGDAVGPIEDPAADQVWEVNADEPVSFQIEPLIGDGVPTMGRYQYQAVLDAQIDAGLLDEDGVTDGYLYTQVPAGEHLATFENEFGDTVELLIRAR